MDNLNTGLAWASAQLGSPGNQNQLKTFCPDIQKSMNKVNTTLMAMVVAIGGDNFLMKVDKMLSDLVFSWHFFFFFKKKSELHNVIMSLSTRVEMDIRNTTMQS
jgi:hypothetical protein